MRPTRQRLLLASLLFGGRGHRHVTAEQLHREAEQMGITISLATVYNTLNQFIQAGLIRSIAMDAKGYFDTNTSDHHHFYVEGEDRIIDIPGGIEIENLPEPPPGMEIRNIDVMVWVKPSAR